MIIQISKDDSLSPANRITVIRPHVIESNIEIRVVGLQWVQKCNCAELLSENISSESRLKYW